MDNNKLLLFADIVNENAREVTERMAKEKRKTEIRNLISTIFSTVAAFVVTILCFLVFLVLPCIL